MQLALSRLNHVRIAGQPTTLPLSYLRSIYEQIASAGAAAMESNAGKGYQHHIGLNSAECIDVLRAFAESVWLRGLGGLIGHLGVKLNGVCINDDLLTKLWPNAFYVVCVRHPWETWVSLRNSYAPLIEWVTFSETWADHVEAAIGNNHAILARLEDSEQKTAEQIQSMIKVHPIKQLEKGLMQKVHAADTNRPRVIYAAEQYSCSERFAALAKRLGYQIRNSILKEGS